MISVSDFTKSNMLELTNIISSGEKMKPHLLSYKQLFYK